MESFNNFTFSPKGPKQEPDALELDEIDFNIDDLKRQYLLETITFKGLTTERSSPILSKLNSQRHALRTDSFNRLRETLMSNKYTEIELFPNSSDLLLKARNTNINEVVALRIYSTNIDSSEDEILKYFRKEANVYSE
jgi:hypothetical protein